MPANFDLKGGADLSKALAEIEREAATKVGEFAVRTSANELRAELVKAAPFDPSPGGMSEKYGHLRDNLRVRKIKPRKADRVIYRVGVGRAWWGALVEFGTFKMPAQPWFRPTFDHMQAALARGIVENVRTGLDRAAKRAARLAKKKG